MITIEYLDKYEKDIKNYDYEVKRITRNKYREQKINIRFCKWKF